MLHQINIHPSMHSFDILVVGLGIGKLYKSILSEYNVDTLDIDTNLNPTYTSIKQISKIYDLIIICTPNYTHESVYLELRDKGKKFLIEKPGFSSYENWQRYDNIYLVKNNMYRDIYPEIKKCISENEIGDVTISWTNSNRIPNPGSWFTDNEKSYGGVSADLMPHLMSIYASISSELNSPIYKEKTQYHSLKSLESSDYGLINHHGIYNVDDYNYYVICDSNRNYNLIADWKSDLESFIGVQVNDIIFDFGLCPEPEYLKMVNDILFETNLIDHKKIDKFIHLNIH